MVTWGVTKFLQKNPSLGNLDQFGQKELVHVGSLVNHASNLWPKPAREYITRVQALTTQINLTRMAPPQLVVFIEKQAGECMTPSPSEERNWSQTGPANHPRWKWKSPDIMVSLSLGENHPMLWLESVFVFPVNALTLYKLTKLH